MVTVGTSHINDQYLCILYLWVLYDLCVNRDYFFEQL
jgi:hypothetical protein